MTGPYIRVVPRYKKVNNSNPIVSTANNEINLIIHECICIHVYVYMYMYIRILYIYILFTPDVQIEKGSQRSFLHLPHILIT